MSRKRCHRRVVVPLPPRGLRPMLVRDQVRDLAICHLQTLDCLVRGTPTEATLWDLVGAVLTWSRAADLTGRHVDEMRAQLELATRVVERYGRTGRIGLTGVEYQAARLGVEVMDDLAETIDRPTAVAAADWGEARLQELVARQGAGRRAAEGGPLERPVSRLVDERAE